MSEEGFRTSIIEHRDEDGRGYLIERLERVVDVADFPSEEVNIGCEACHNYGKNLACPPFSPYLRDYIENSGTARVICLRVPLEQYHGIVMEERYRTAYRMMKGLLEEELLEWREKGYLVAGSGACRACVECAIEEGGTDCRFPDKRIFSLEAMGVSVVLLTETAFGFSLEWSGNENAADFVSALGAVFTLREQGQEGYSNQS